jgi:hypothetical protein
MHEEVLATVPHVLPEQTRCDAWRPDTAVPTLTDNDRRDDGADNECRENYPGAHLPRPESNYRHKSVLIGIVDYGIPLESELVLRLAPALHPLAVVVIVVVGIVVRNTMHHDVFFQEARIDLNNALSNSNVWYLASRVISNLHER